jgi:hypothetical protein
MPGVAHFPVPDRVKHLGRLMRAGLPRLWEVIIIAIAFVGGSIVLAAAWSLRHLLIGAVIALATVVVVITEGSYREFRSAEKAHEDEMASQRAAHAEHAAPAQGPAEDPRLPALLDLKAEGGGLRHKVLKTPAITWSLTDLDPKEHLRALAFWDKHAAEVLEPGWLEQFTAEPALSPLVLAQGPYARLMARIDARIGVLDVLIRNLQKRQDARPVATATPHGLEVVIDNERPTPFPGRALILEIEFHVTNHDPVGHPLSMRLEGGRPFFPPDGDPDDPEYLRISRIHGEMSQRRSQESLPPHVDAGQTVRGVLVNDFGWDPAHDLPGYTLIIWDGRREFRGRPHGAAEAKEE